MLKDETQEINEKLIHCIRLANYIEFLSDSEENTKKLKLTPTHILQKFKLIIYPKKTKILILGNNENKINYFI